MSVTISGGGGVKSVQRGTVASSANLAKNFNVTIAPIKQEKAIVQIEREATPSQSAIDSALASTLVRSTITANNEIQIMRNRDDADIYITWQVIEYA